MWISPRVIANEFQIRPITTRQNCRDQNPTSLQIGDKRLGLDLYKKFATDNATKFRELKNLNNNIS